MKQCIQCGKELQDSDLFCGSCGGKQETVCAPAGRGHVETQIEQEIAEYYNLNRPPMGRNGKYVVQHRETVVRGGVCYMVVRYETNNDGAVISTPVEGVSVNMATGDCTMGIRLCKRTWEKRKPRIVCIVILMIGIFCWLALPFLGTGEKDGTTALQLVSMLSEYQSWFRQVGFIVYLLFVPLVGMIIGVILAADGSKGGVCVTSILTLLPMALFLVYILNNVDFTAYGGAVVFEVLGAGFWGPLVALTSAIPLSGVE